MCECAWYFGLCVNLLKWDLYVYVCNAYGKNAIETDTFMSLNT